MEESSIGCAGAPVLVALSVIDTFALATVARAGVSVTVWYGGAGSARARMMGSTRLMVPTSEQARDCLPINKCSNDTPGMREHALMGLPRIGIPSSRFVEFCRFLTVMNESSFKCVSRDIPTDGLNGQPNASAIPSDMAATELLTHGVCLSGK